MLYLKSLTLNKFKSFKHAELQFSKGFTCIVGPNGSGKSNICDSLLFGMGETALRRLRVDKLGMLINIDSKKAKKSDLQKGQVKISFGGDEPIEVVRVARNDGKSVFKVNGKRHTRQEVLEILKKHRMDIDETNTITQGEITRMMNLNPKERRQLIDIAAGIKEFETKKTEALKELEKVSSKIGESQIILNERMGFLKELEKETLAANKYSDLRKRLVSLNYTVLVERKKDARSSYDELSKEMALIDEKKAKVADSVSGLSAQVDKLSEMRQALTKELSETTSSLGEVNAKLEAANRELATIEVELKTFASDIGKDNVFLEEASASSDSIKKSIKANEENIASLNKKLAEIEPLLAKFSATKKEEPLEIEAKIKETSKAVEELDAQLSECQNTVSSAKADLAGSSSKLQSMQAEHEELAKKLALANEEMAKASAEASSFSKLQDEFQAKANNAEALRSRLANEISGMDSELLRLKEQRAMARGRQSIMLDKLENVFSEKTGFYGKVASLCTYDSKYAEAVEAAAGGRFEYLVVDALPTASKMIEYMKANDVGTATFMPIRELKVRNFDSQTIKLRSLLSLVSYDKKFSKVFDYIFANTYIIEDVADAKKHGIGSHRYVTLDGDLVEQSGVVSGGSRKRKRSLVSIENRIGELTNTKTRLSKQLEESEQALMEARKEKASLDVKLGSHNATTSSYSKEIQSIESELQRNERFFKTLKVEVEEKQELVQSKSKEMQELSSKLSEAKQLSKRLYEESLEASKAIARHGMSKAEKEKLDKLRSDAESLKINKAELTRENELLNGKVKELADQAAQRHLHISDCKKEMKEKDKRNKELFDIKTELQNAIKKSSASNKSKYEQLEKLESQIAIASTERGKSTSSMENLERQLTEARLKRGQVEVRLSDLEAELKAYAEVPEIAEGKAVELEREAATVRAKIEALGPVNLKAPEIYETKKKDVDEANGKLATLEAERLAVMKMIEEIDSKKYRIFMDAFEQVGKNFERLYNYIFPGKAKIQLDNEKDPFNSGLHIKISEGKSYKNTNLLSGGEKSLVLLMLLFSIHMHKPSPLYVFDEVDAALDKENSKKMSQLIKQLSSDSQFIVVSHNDSMVSNADVAIGVTKVNNESVAVGLEVANILASKNKKGA